MRRYDAVIFDLDGTLLDTLEDLMGSVNYALECSGFPARSLAEIRQFVGNGVAKLVARAVPAGTDSELEAKCLKEFEAHYLLHMRCHTAPYPGILPLLHALKSRGYRLAVASNKFEDAVKLLCPEFFGTLFDAMVGASDRVAKKPAPDMLLGAVAALGTLPERTVYVGDSEVDVATAQHAGLDCIAVTWGFRDRDVLVEAGAQTFADTAQALLALLDS